MGNVLHTAAFNWNGGYILPWLSFNSSINYNATIHSQDTDWRGEGYNYNVWHSMKSPWEAEQGVSSESARIRGMQFGWSSIFGAAKNGTSLNHLKKNSKQLQMLGQGLHALQDAYAHKGTHEVDANHIVNDMSNNADMKEAQEMTNSAVTTYRLLTNDFEGLNKQDVVAIKQFDGMTNKQFNTLLNKINEYLKSSK